MKKRFRRFFIALSLIGLAPSLSSCNFIFGGDEGYHIQNVSQSTAANGDVTLTISYTDETKDPLVVTLPAGLSGKPGVGIANVDYSFADNTLTLTISYTDPSVVDTVLSIPVVQGQDGKGIANVAMTQDESGNNVLSFTYSDGTTNSFTIPKAQNGQNGVGIDTISSQLDSQTGNYIITITYTDGREATTIEIPPSENGTGVSFISYSETQSDENNFGLLISYTDGTTSILRIPRPQATHWYYGDVAPSSTIGIAGDYYLNIATGEVYFKSDIGWEAPLFSMKGTGATQQKEYCTIYFDANGGSFIGGENVKFLTTMEVGTNIPLTGSNSFETIGVPNMNGFKFSGWYTSPTDEYLSGQFTDLTPIYGEQLILYAHWEVEE